MKKILMFGSFDGIHPGHINLFEQASKYGDHITVILARDQTIMEVKGRNPTHDEKIRHDMLLGVPIVNEVRMGSLDDKYAAILEIKPDVICLGYDQTAFVDRLESYLHENNLSVDIVRLEAYKPHKYKSSIING